ncbi:Hsp70 family protein [Acinetobacter soli]
MVGGSTRIPLVRETVQKYYGRPLRVDINPDEVVIVPGTRFDFDHPVKHFDNRNVKRSAT